MRLHAVIDNSVEMEIQDASNHESSTSYQKRMEISAGPHYNLLKWICIMHFDSNLFQVQVN